MLTMVFGLTAIMYSQIRIIRGLGQSVTAFYAADTGIERALYNIRRLKESETWPILEDFGTGSDYGYTVSKIPCGTKTCLRSIGTYKETKRAIEASY